MPDCVAPVAQDTELDERASGQKEEPEKAVSKESYHADPDTQLGGTEDEEFTEVSPCKKRALTPPYIPGMGILQTWPKFRFNNVSEEGIRTLRKRTGRKMEQPEEPPMIPCKSKERRGASIEMYSITALAESSKEGPDTQLGEREDKESTVFSRCRKRKRALTPPYIPEKGILQTWPKFGFENVSEGVRALRKRTGKMEHSEEPAMIPLRSKELKGALNEENFSTMPAESSVWGCIDKQDLKRRAPNGRLHNAPHSLRIRRQAAPTKAPDNGSPTTSDEDFTICKASLSAIPIRGTLAVQPTAVQRSQKPFNDTGNSPWRGCKGRGERPSSHNRQ